MLAMISTNSNLGQPQPLLGLIRQVQPAWAAVMHSVQTGGVETWPG